MTSIAEKYAAQFMPNGEVSLADLIQAAVDEAQSVPVVWEPVVLLAEGHFRFIQQGRVAVVKPYKPELIEEDDIALYRRPTHSIPAAELATLREKAETHALEMRAYEATVQNLEKRIRQLEKERVPEGWRIAERNTGSIIVYKEKIGSCVVSECPETERTIPEAILWALAKDILAAAPQPKKEGE